MAQIGLFYGSTDGTTREVARRVQRAFGGPGEVAIYAVEDATAADLARHTRLILATSTWDEGHLQEDWADFLDVLDATPLHDKAIALIGTGDASGYPATFLDGMGILYEKIAGKVWLLVGQWPAAGYRFAASRALRRGHFVGLALDEVNQPERTDARIAAWVKQVQEEWGL